MKLELAKSAGFCYGVKRAVEMAEDAASVGYPCVMLGALIHNRHVTQRLSEHGVQTVNSIEEIPDGASVILRSHGEAKCVHQMLAERGNPVVDAACPNVSRIHRIVEQAEQAGRTAVIIGNPAHPEVVAIAGWCRDPVVLSGPSEVDAWLISSTDVMRKPITVVSQTTSTQALWGSCVEKIKKVCTNAEIFDTICGATYKRQAEAQELAARCDAMIVIGDPNSSNTKRLAELCAALCPAVVSIEGASELEPTLFKGAALVGITAGASTPGWIIKEVFDKMSEEIMEIEESFAELLEKSIKTLNTGDKVTGIVPGISNTEI